MSLVTAGCRAPDAAPDLAPDAIAIPAEPQREGDPERGYEVLTNGDFVSCGVPRVAYDAVVGPASAPFRLEGREPGAEGLYYAMNLVTTGSGVEVVGANCFTCHASWFRDQLVLGLGAAEGDFTTDLAPYAAAVGVFVPAEDTAAKAEWEKWSERVVAVAPYVSTDTLGVNPADNLAAALFAHRDRDTLAWSAEPTIPPPPTEPVPTDVPPWWVMHKKNAMFYTGAGRGDQARIMMSASALCTDELDEARVIDADFPDVRAYIRSLEAPPYPFPIDEALAESGEGVFDAQCSQCHGTYGEDETYPNLLIPLDRIGTDPMLVTGSGQLAASAVEWFNDSFYGEIARFEPGDGYVAQPLDGIWASAPYLHNASVPTLAGLLDPEQRPTYWTRVAEYDPEQVGWRFEPRDHGKSGFEPEVYDTTRPGYANTGHPFGEGLDPDERRAVLEYLKTL